MDDFGMGYALGQDSSNNNCCNGNGNGGGMWGGDGSWIFAFLIIALIFGGNGWGWGGNNGGGGMGGAGMQYLPYAIGGQGALTRADLCSEFNFNGLDSAVRGLQNGLCDGFYAMNTGMLNGFNTLGSQIATGFHGVDNAICNLGYQQAQLANGINLSTLQGFNGVTAGLNSLSNQLASCCCDIQRQTERGFCDTNYNLATNTTSIIQSAHNDTDRVLAKLDAMEMSRKDETIAALREKLTQANFAASQAAQNAFITANQEAQTAEILRRTGHDCPSAAYIVQPPTPVSFPTNCCGTFTGYNNNGCGSCC